MEENLINPILETNVKLSAYSFIISIVLSYILSYILSKIYISQANSLSNHESLAKIFPLLSVTTTIVIAVVKSSLALSLGLVGALSIVRFRTPIKEPEELVYLFLIIAIGLGCGANQLVITTVGIVFALILIIFYSGYMKRSKKNIEETINLGIIIDQDITDTQINNLINEIKKVSSELKFISMSRTENNTTINFDVKPKKFEKLSMLSGQIKKRFKNSKVVLAYNDDLSL